MSQSTLCLNRVLDKSVSYRCLKNTTQLNEGAPSANSLFQPQAMLHVSLEKDSAKTGVIWNSNKARGAERCSIHLFPGECSQVSPSAMFPSRDLYYPRGI